MQEMGIYYPPKQYLLLIKLIWIYITGVRLTEILYGLNRTDNSAVRLALRKGPQGRSPQEVTPGPFVRPT